MENASFKIEGMSCSCEAGIVEKRIRRLEGIRDFMFMPISNVMKLTFDPSKVTVEDIEKAAAKAGVKAVLQKPKGAS